MEKPLAVDLFSGLDGWGEAFIAEGYRVLSVDIVDMRKELGLPPLEGHDLILEDIHTFDGRRCKDAAVIVASPPCQKYSYMAMPWKKAKALAAWYRESPERIAELNALFNACFRIQREASEAAGRHIPLIVENVKGAQAWVGRAHWHYGSYYLWGDIPALMPSVSSIKNNGGSWFAVAPHNKERSQNPDGRKIPASCAPGRWADRDVKRLRDAAGSKGGHDWFGRDKNCSLPRSYASRSPQRQAASAMIAKIPYALARHIAWAFYPRKEGEHANS